MTESVRRAIRAAEESIPRVRVVYTEAIAADTYFLRPQESGAMLFVNSTYSPATRRAS